MINLMTMAEFNSVMTAQKAAREAHVAAGGIRHIRRRLIRAKGNQFYKDQRDRNQGTYCGSDCTEFDISWKEKSAAFNNWITCPECIKKREEG